MSQTFHCGVHQEPHAYICEPQKRNIKWVIYHQMKIQEIKQLISSQHYSQVPSFSILSTYILHTCLKRGHWGLWYCGIWHFLLCYFAPARPCECLKGRASTNHSSLARLASGKKWSSTLWLMLRCILVNRDKLRNSYSLLYILLKSWLCCC